MSAMRAHSPGEARLYLKVTPCSACGQGPWETQQAGADSTAPAASPDRLLTLNARCAHCGAERAFVFQCSPADPGRPADARHHAEPAGETINPTERPSEIIDLGQWLSLFHLLAETAEGPSEKPEARRDAWLAAQCLDEALKFYPSDDELPAESAFTTDASRQAFAEHPEWFARQRLRDMRERLPGLRGPARRPADEARTGSPRPWWKFWKR